MIVLPNNAPMQAVLMLNDMTLTQRAGLGGPTKRIARPGSRYKCEFSIGPLTYQNASEWIAKLNQGKLEGVQINVPLLRTQGSPGSPVVDGADQGGTTLNVRGLTPSYIAKSDYVLSIEDASGQHYVHKLAEGVVADTSGNAALKLATPLRTPFADGATVHLANPIMQGFIDGPDWSWELNAARVVPINFMVEEYA